MKKMFVLLSVLFATSAFSKECVSINPQNTKVTWKAFKTYSKIGVNGGFTSVSFGEKAQGKTIAEAITNKTFSIDTKTVSTGDTARDATIINSFFSKGDFKISGKVKSFSRKKLVMDLNLNGVTKEIPLAYEIEGNKVKANGFIDVLDFNANAALAALHKVCGTLHEGKTWSDVEIGLEFTTTKCE